MTRKFGYGAAALVSFGFSLLGIVFTAVVSAGPEEAEARLCRFLNNYLPDVADNCHALDALVRVSGFTLAAPAALFLIAFVFTILKFTRRTPQPSNGQPASNAPPPYSGDGHSFPDITIGEVFRYIDPDCLGEEGRKTLEIGRQILDKLSIGQLTAWGRVADRGTPTLVEITDRAYWQTADLTYWYFDAGCEQLVHVQPAVRAHGHAYRYRRNPAGLACHRRPRKRASRF